MSKRVNVMMSETLFENVEYYAERYGVSKSAMISFCTGMMIDQLRQADTLVHGKDGLGEQMLENMSHNIKENNTK